MSDASPGEEHVDLSEAQRQLLAEEAARHDLEPDELLVMLLAAYRQVATEELEFATAEDIATTREEFQGLLEDVRERVIQVKRETDQKAPTDHTHPELAEQVDTAKATVADFEETLEKLQSDLTTVETEVAELSETLSGGFDNYEEILEYLLDQTDLLEQRVDTLAEALLETRGRLREVSGQRREQELLAELKADANRAGVSRGTCDDCGQRVNVGLLTKPRCPHCSATFTELAVSRRLGGLLTEYRLKNDDHPELTGAKRPEIDDEIAAGLEETTERPEFPSEEERVDE